MRLITFLFFLLTPVFVYSSHIYGGEIRVENVCDNIHKIQLLTYFDNINGNPGAIDSEVFVAIFKKSDNELLEVFTLSLTGRNDLPDTNPLCRNGFVDIDVLEYEQMVSLPSEDFNDPAGYYLVWQRCCRPYTLVNIISEDPVSGGSASGATVYTEIPSLAQFVNSSPNILVPKTNGTCVGQPFYIDMRAFDEDGDSVVYSITSPYGTPTSMPRPVPPSAAPYMEVAWRNGFGPGSYIAGMPDLSVTQEGAVSATPTLAGSFTFTVKFEEYRNDTKIGEVRRDFTIEVGDCPEGDGSEVELAVSKTIDNTELTEGQVIDFGVDEEVCFIAEITDTFARVTELSLNVVSSDLSPGNQENIDIQRREGLSVFDVCLPDCFFIKRSNYTLNFIAFDVDCPIPSTDTLSITVNKPQLSNQPVVFQNSQNQVIQSYDENFVIAEQDTLESQTIIITDEDMDSIAVKLFGLDSVAAQIIFDIKSQSKGLIEGVLKLPVGCDVSPADKILNIEARIIASDIGNCLANNTICLPVSFSLDRGDKVSSLLESSDTLVFPLSNNNTLVKLTDLFESEGNDTFSFDSVIYDNQELNAFLTGDTLVVRPNVEGTYPVSLLVTKNDCFKNWVELTLTFLEVTALLDDFNSDNLILYPNPAKDFIQVEFYNDASKFAQLQLLNLNGKVVYQENIGPSTEIISHNISLDNILPGVYILIYTQNGVSASRNIVVK